jgi:acid phosphatase family membrane protein YuiD
VPSSSVRERCRVTVLATSMGNFTGDTSDSYRITIANTFVIIHLIIALEKRSYNGKSTPVGALLKRD